MAFKPGHKLSKGRPVGAKNKEDYNSLRKLLAENFSENRILIRHTLNEMLKNFNHQIVELNERIANADPNETEYTANLRFYASTKSSLLSEFKWLMELKASLEPKEVKNEHEGLPQTQFVIIRPSESNNANKPETISRQICI